MSSGQAVAGSGGIPFGASAARTAGSVGAAYRVERRKLWSQLPTRLLALVCLLGPFVFAGVLKVQSGSPADSLYGVWVHSSGFALSLVVLGFSGSWGLPLLAGVLAGDVFSSEDRHGTWKTVLTRSCTRRHLFAGKLWAIATFALALLALLAVSSLVAGVVLVGAHSLVSLDGTVFSVGHCLVLVLAAWALSALPMLAFASLAVLLSIATRNGIVGVLGAAVTDLVMQLLALVGKGVWLHSLLVASAFDAWHPLFVTHPFAAPIVVGELVSAAWIAACVGASWLLLRRRDFTGAPPGRRAGWAAPVRVAVVSAAVIAFLAIASNWGPSGITAVRVKNSITPTFNNLTLLQQQELGRVVPPGARLNVLTSCSRRGSAPAGPGNWICTLTVFIPQPGAVPFQQTPVTYDVTVQSSGCYKAESPPSFVGQQSMRDADGNQVVNPLFVIYGCFNPL